MLYDEFENELEAKYGPPLVSQHYPSPIGDIVAVAIIAAAVFVYAFWH